MEARGRGEDKAKRSRRRPALRGFEGHREASRAADPGRGRCRTSARYHARRMRALAPDWLRRRLEVALRVRASPARARVACSSSISVVPAADPAPASGR